MVIKQGQLIEIMKYVIKILLLIYAITMAGLLYFSQQ